MNTQNENEFGFEFDGERVRDFYPDLPIVETSIDEEERLADQACRTISVSSEKQSFDEAAAFSGLPCGRVVAGPRNERRAKVNSSESNTAFARPSPNAQSSRRRIMGIGAKLIVVILLIVLAIFAFDRHESAAPKEEQNSPSSEAQSKSKVPPIADVSPSPELVSLPPDLSQDLSGTWLGVWQDCQDKTGKGGLVIKERTDFTIYGRWCDERQIQKGHRVSRDTIIFESYDRNQCKYDVIGKIKDRGRTLLLLYSYVAKSDSFKNNMSPGSVVGVHRLTRDGISSYTDPQPTTLSGYWSGMDGFPRLPRTPSSVTVWRVDWDKINIVDSSDGIISVEYCDDKNFGICKGEKINGKMWWQIKPAPSSNPAPEETVEDIYGEYNIDVLRLQYRNQEEGYTVHTWYIRDESQSLRGFKSNLESTILPETKELGKLSINPQTTQSAVEVTVEALNDNPAKYNGKTIQIACQLSGRTITRNKDRGLRLFVKGKSASLDASRMQKDGINFILPKSKQSLLHGFTDLFSPAKLTVTVKQGMGGYWRATVSAIEKTGH